jgi:hypothetical protein
MRTSSSAVVAILTAIGVALGSAPPAAQVRAADNCVALGTPNSSLTYTYVRTERGATVEYSTQWEEVTDTGSRQRTTRAGRGGGTSNNVSRHRIENDVSVIQETVQSGSDGSGAFTSTTVFEPGVVGDPFGRACAGRSWPIASVTAINRSARGTFSAKSDAGELKILAVKERIIVPAGTFDSIHYTRTTTSARGTIVDEYWKSIEHGVTVKHQSTLLGTVTTEVLQSIR